MPSLLKPLVRILRTFPEKLQICLYNGADVQYNNYVNFLFQGGVKFSTGSEAA